MHNTRAVDGREVPKHAGRTERGAIRFGLAVAILTVATMLGCIYATALITLIYG